MQKLHYTGEELAPALHLHPGDNGLEILLATFFIVVTKHLAKTGQRRKGLLWLTVQ